MLKTICISLFFVLGATAPPPRPAESRDNKIREQSWTTNRVDNPFHGPAIAEPSLRKGFMIKTCLIMNFESIVFKCYL